MLLVEYMYSLVVVSVKVASTDVMIQVGCILPCMLLCSLHEPRCPLSC